MIVRNVPLISFIAVPMFLVSKETTTIVTRGDHAGQGECRSIEDEEIARAIDQGARTVIDNDQAARIEFSCRDAVAT
jgi:hypothetical protein